MSSDTRALNVTAPDPSEPLVAALSAATISAALDLASFAGRYVTICVDTGAGVATPFYYQFGSNAAGGGTRTSASATPTNVTADQRMLFEPTGRLDITIGKDQEVRLYSVPAGYYRIAPTSSKG
jgi:hypothetical protein